MRWRLMMSSGGGGVGMGCCCREKGCRRHALVVEHCGLEVGGPGCCGSRVMKGLRGWRCCCRDEELLAGVRVNQQAAGRQSIAQLNGGKANRLLLMMMVRVARLLLLLLGHEHSAGLHW